MEKRRSSADNAAAEEKQSNPGWTAIIMKKQLGVVGN